MLKNLTKIWILIVLLCISACSTLNSNPVSSFGGSIVAEGTVEGEFCTTFSKMWRAAYTIGNLEGNIYSEDREKGIIKIESGPTMVMLKFKITEIGVDKIRLNVEARGYLEPKLKVAEDVFIKIARELEAQNK